jgi:hypothetical protein
MSGINGDKSRFHRERKQKIARRMRNRELFQREVTPSKSAKNPAPAKAKVSA